MWLFECGLDTIEWRRTIVVYLSAMAPNILAPAAREIPWLPALADI